MKITTANRKCFADARSCVVEEQQESAVAKTREGHRVDGPEFVNAYETAVA
jgi:hypothetical protein